MFVIENCVSYVHCTHKTHRILRRLTITFNVQKLNEINSSNGGKNSKCFLIKKEQKKTGKIRKM